MSDRSVYRALSRVFSIVLLLVALGAFLGGNFAHDYVKSQLGQEKITMPTEQGIANLPKESQDALKPFLGKPLDNGPAAQAYANNYIWEHMQSACKAVKTSDGQTITVPADKCTYSGIGDVAREYTKKATDAGKSAADAAKDPAVVALNAARDNNFKGDSLRSMLLTAYAFHLIGTIAKWAALACLLGGLLLAALGWFLLNDKKHTGTRTVVEPAHTTTAHTTATTTAPTTTTVRTDGSTATK